MFLTATPRASLHQPLDDQVVCVVLQLPAATKAKEKSFPAAFPVSVAFQFSPFAPRQSRPVSPPAECFRPVLYFSLIGFALCIEPSLNAWSLQSDVVSSILILSPAGCEEIDVDGDFLE